MKLIKLLLFTITISFVITVTAKTNFLPSDLDLAFGNNGLVTTNIDYGAGGDNTFSDIAIQNDGKIIIVGNFDGRDNEDVALTRINPDGSRDKTFGDNGSVITPVLFSDELIRSIKIQSDGKIVVAGEVYFEEDQSQSYILILRYNQNGTPDLSFNGNGRVLTQVQNRMDELGNRILIYAMEIQLDGKILVAGVRSGFTLVARYNTNGTLDQSFATNGIALFRVIQNHSSYAHGITLQTDGKIVLVGYEHPIFSNTPVRLTVVRLNTNGTFDTTFASTGIKIIQIGSSPSTTAEKVLIDAQNRILILGKNFPMSGSTSNYAVLRLLPNGDFDNSFSSDGVATFNIEDSEGVTGTDIPVDIGIRNNKIYLTGTSINITNIVRLNIDGTLDTTFDGDGIFFVTSAERVKGLDFDSEDNLVIVGIGNSTSYGVVAKITEDAELVNDFDYDGISEVGFGESFDEAKKVQYLNDGKILVSGVTSKNLKKCHTVVKYNSDGSLDQTFNQELNQFMCTKSSFNFYVFGDTIVRPNGKILLIDSKTIGDLGSALNYFLTQLNADGSIDGSFGTNGFVETIIEDESFNYAKRGLLLPDGSLLVAGITDSQASGGADFFTIAKYDLDGNLVSSFGNNGVAIPIATISERFGIANIFPQPENKLLIVGTNFSNSQDILLVRINSDGSLDKTYGENGRISFEARDFVSEEMIDAEMLPSGQIISLSLYNGDNALTKFSSDGILDTSFGDKGSVIFDVTNIELGKTGLDFPSDIDIQQNGKYVIGGSARISLGDDYPFIARFNVDGTFDKSFDKNGVALLNLNSERNERGESIDIQPDGKILLAGFAFLNSEFRLQDFLLTRYLGDPVEQNSSAPFDFDGDSKTDVSIFRPNAGQWWYLRSSDFGNAAFAFGTNTDKLVPADYTGDGKTDIAFWRESTGEWFILRSEDSSFYGFPFGSAGDIPAPGDFDGDGIADAAVYRPSQTVWYIQRSSDGQTAVQQFGVAEDLPTVADFDGDGKDDIAVFRPSVSQWWQLRSTAGTIGYQFGTTGDKTIQGDYTGDGKADVGVFRPSTGQWLILRSEDSSFFGFPFGVSTDIPSPGDYDGDGTFDAAVFRPSTNTWFYNGSTSGNVQLNFGVAGDIPIPNSYSQE